MSETRAETRAKRWGRRLGAGKVARSVRLPRDVAALREAQEQLRDRVAFLEAELADVRRRAGHADDAIARLTDAAARLTDGVAAVSADVTESRRLSLRVAQMADVVMDRLATSTPTTSQ